MKKNTILRFVSLFIIGFQIIQNPDDYDKIISFLTRVTTIVKAIVKEKENKRIKKK